MSDEENATPIPADEGPSRAPLAGVDVVGLGMNAMDYITVLGSFPRAGEKTAISEIRLEPGGQVATALATCARLGLKTRYLGSVGGDELGRIQIESLRNERIDTSGVRVVPGATTQMAIALLEEGVGERTILWHHDARLTFPEDEVSPEAVTSGRILHLDGRDSQAALRAAGWADGAGIPIVIDIDKIYDETTDRLLELVDYLIAAEEFAIEATGCGNVSEAALALARRFPQATTGVTLGPAGAVFVLDGAAEHFPAFKVDVRDTTGAGDVFHGAFIFGVLEEWEIRKTVRFAHAVAAMKCRQLGARAGIPRLAEVEAFLETAEERS